VVWGKIISWISKEKYLQVKTDYYDEEDTLIKSFIGTVEQKMDGRDIFAHWEMIPYNEPGNKTILDYKDIKFNIKIEESYFSEQNMKRVR
jgi:outer membrane lipoprotein-sorting protein